MSNPPPTEGLRESPDPLTAENLDIFQAQLREFGQEQGQEQNQEQKEQKQDQGQKQEKKPAKPPLREDEDSHEAFLGQEMDRLFEEEAAARQSEFGFMSMQWMRHLIYMGIAMHDTFAPQGHKLWEEGQDEIIVWRPRYGSIAIRNDPDKNNAPKLSNLEYLTAVVAHVTAKTDDLNTEFSLRQMVQTPERMKALFRVIKPSLVKLLKASAGAVGEDGAQTAGEEQAAEEEVAINSDDAGQDSNPEEQPYDINLRGGAFVADGNTDRFNNENSRYHEKIKWLLRRLFGHAGAKEFLNRTDLNLAGKRVTDLLDHCIDADIGTISTGNRADQLLRQAEFLYRRLSRFNRFSVEPIFAEKAIENPPTNLGGAVLARERTLLWTILRCYPLMVSKDFRGLVDTDMDIAVDYQYHDKILDLTEASQGKLFRFWLDAVPSLVLFTLQHGPRETKKCICGLVAASLLCESKAAGALRFAVTRMTQTVLPPFSHQNHAEKLESDAERICTWLDGLPLLDMPASAAEFIEEQQPGQSDGSYDGSVPRTTTPDPEWFTQNPTLPSLVDSVCESLNLKRQAQYYHRGGGLDEPDRPPRKRARYETSSQMSLQHDQSVHSSSGNEKHNSHQSQPAATSASETSTDCVPDSAKIEAEDSEDKDKDKGEGKGEEKEDDSIVVKIAKSE